MGEGPLTARGRWLRLLNYALVIALTGLLVGAFLRRVAVLQEEAERFAFERSYTALRHAVHLQAVRELAAGGPERLLVQIGADPLPWTDWAAPLPGGSGVSTAADPAAARAAGWRFDAARRIVCYDWRTRAGESGCWAVRAEFDDLDGDGQLDWPQEVPVGLRLMRWP